MESTTAPCSALIWYKLELTFCSWTPPPSFPATPAPSVPTLLGDLGPLDCAEEDFMLLMCLFSSSPGSRGEGRRWW